MNAADTELYVETERERVTRWRVQELERAGYDFGSAAELAIHPEVDLHLAISLLERGCKPDVALRILL